MAKKGNETITQTGPQSYRELQYANNQSFENNQDDLDFINRINQHNAQKVAAYEAGFNVNPQYVQSTLMQNSRGEDSWGNSVWDDDVARGTEADYLSDTRAENQWTIAKLGAGIAKGAILAGTTFLDGTIGLAVGATTAITEGSLSGLWDNDFSEAMQKITELAEKELPNYYTQKELNGPWYENIFTANFIGDKFIKNLGFTVGAFYGGGVVSGGMKALGITRNLMAGAKRLGATINTLKNIKMGGDIVRGGTGAFISSLNEARIEAINNSKDWFELHKTQLDDEHYANIEAIKEQYGGTEMEQQLIAAENSAYAHSLGKLSESRLKMGNADMLFNLPILMASNVVQFGKLFANGFKSNRSALNIIGDRGNYMSGSTKAGAAWGITKGALSEGTEEISQSLASNVSGNYYSTDVNNFYKAKRDPKATQEVLDWTKAFSSAINETVNDGSAWEEFFIGSLTGALGMPRFRGTRNAEGKFQSPITIEGGAINEWKEFRSKQKEEQEVADYMNARMKSPEFTNYYQGFIRHKKYQNDMDDAVVRGDSFDFKNAEHSQMVSDIVMFDKAGKIEDLKQAIEEVSGTTKEDLESIVKNTTSKTEDGKLVGPFSQYASTDSDGNIIANFGTEQSEKAMAEQINKNKQEILDTIDKYQQIKNNLVLSKNGNKLTDEQLEELTWMESQIDNWSDRAIDMSNDIKSVMGNVLENLNALLRFNEEVRSFEGQKSADLSDKFKQADENITSIISAIKVIRLMRRQDDESMIYTLAANPKFVDSLIKEINMIDETVLSENKKQDTITKLKDLVRLGNASKIYNAKLKEYLENPQKQAEEHVKADEQAVQDETKRQSDNLKSSLNEASTLNDFRNIIDEQDDTENKDKVLAEMEDEGNTMAKNYREASQYYTEVEKSLNESNIDPQTKQDAIKLLQDQFNNSENLEQLANSNSIYINNENAFDEDSNGDIELSNTRFQKAQYEVQRAMSKVNNDNEFKDRFSPEYKEPVEEKRSLTESFKEVGLDKGEFAGSIINNTSNKTVNDSSTLSHIQAEIIRKNARRVFEDATNSDNKRLHDAIVSNTHNTSANANILHYLYKALDAVKDGRMSVDEAMALLEYHLNVNDDTHKNLLSNLNKKVKEDDATTTGDSGVTTVPPVDTSTMPTTEIPAGNITQEMVVEENKKVNEKVETPQRPSRDTSNQFYRPAIPELHIEASKEGDFRPFVDVVAEREKGADFSDIYNYLRDNGAFDYLNQGKLKPGDEIGFMIDPEFEERVKDKEWHKAPTIFLIDKKSGQVVGSLDESDYSVSKYEGLKGLEERIRNEYANRPVYQPSKDDLIHITNTSEGLSHIGELQEWSKKTSDIRTEPDGFGTKNGLFYYKKSYRGGRGGDNITIWFKIEPSQEIKNNIEQLLKSSRTAYELGDKLFNTIQSVQSDSKIQESSHLKRMGEKISNYGEDAFDTAALQDLVRSVQPTPIENIKAGDKIILIDTTNANNVPHFFKSDKIDGLHFIRTVENVYNTDGEHRVFINDSENPQITEQDLTINNNNYKFYVIPKGGVYTNDTTNPNYVNNGIYIPVTTNSDKLFDTNYSYPLPLSKHEKLDRIVNNVAVYTENGDPSRIEAVIDDNNKAILKYDHKNHTWTLIINGNSNTANLVKASLQQLPAGAAVSLHNPTLKDIDAISSLIGSELTISDETYKLTIWNLETSLRLPNDPKDSDLKDIKAALKPYLEKLGVKDLDNSVSLKPLYKGNFIDVRVPLLKKSRNTTNLNNKDTSKSQESKKDSAKNTQPKSKFIASPTTRVSKVMSGKVPYSNTERSLKDIPNVSNEGKAPIFGIIKNGVLTTNGKIDDNLIVKPVDMAQKEGRLYLLIPNGAGKYMSTAIRVKHFNNEEFNLDDSSVSNTPIGKDISDAISKLANAVSQDDVSQAMQNLAQDLYMQDIMITWFDGRAGSGIVISKKVRKPDGTYEKIIIDGKEQIREDKYDVYFSTSKKSVEIGGITYDATVLEDTSMLGVPKDPNDIYKEILKHLIGFNLPIQVSTKRINDGAYNNRLINSGILTSNITNAATRGTWFTTDYFDNNGNLHEAINPVSVIPQPKRKVETPVGGTNSAIAGTKITSISSNKAYYVDLKTNTIKDDQGKSIEITDSNRILFDLAWAQDNFGSFTNSTVMTDNKVILPSGKVLDRNTQKYLEGDEAQNVKDIIVGKKKEKGDKVAESKRVINEIYENQKKVDKTKTDRDYYYVLENDGQYHKYSRVHNRLGSNWVESVKQIEALNHIRTKLSELVDNPSQYKNYLGFLENKYKVKLDAYKDKTDTKSRDAIIIIIRDLMSGTNSMRALNAGTAVDSIIRQYFTINDISKIERPDNMTEQAFIDLITTLSNIKSNMELMGERFLADNIVLFQKYKDGTRVAGEVDILAVDKEGNFKIYDVKTSRYSFYEFTDRYGHKLNYFNTASPTQRMSAKDYYTLQLSAYKNLFESQYGVPITKLAIMPFVLSYDKDKVSGVHNEKGIPITYNPAVNVPLENNVSTNKPTEVSKTPVQKEQILPTNDTSLELQNPIEDLAPEYSMNTGDNERVGYFEIDGKLHKGYLTKLSTIGGIQVEITKVPNITKGFGRPGESAHVASNSYYAVFPNGKTFLALKNNPVQGGYSQSQVEQAITKMLEGNPQKVKDMSNEKTVLFNPNTVQPTDITTTTEKTPATINQGTPQIGAALTIQREQSINNKKPSRSRHHLYIKDGKNTKPIDFIVNDLANTQEGRYRNTIKNLLKFGWSLAAIDSKLNTNLVELAGYRGTAWDSLSPEERKSFYKEFILMEGYTDFKKDFEDLGFLLNTDYDISDIEKLISADLYKSPLFSKIMDIAKQFGIKVRFSNKRLDSRVGGVYADNVATITTSPKDSDFEHALIHELIHSVTLGIIDAPKESLTREQQQALTILEDTFKLAKEKLAGYYGLESLKEFVAELSNPKFREALESIKIDKNLSLWDKIKDFFKKLFGNALDVSDNALMKLLDNPIKDKSGESNLLKLDKAEYGKVISEIRTNKSSHAVYGNGKNTFMFGNYGYTIVTLDNGKTNYYRFYIDKESGEIYIINKINDRYYKKIAKDIADLDKRFPNAKNHLRYTRKITWGNLNDMELQILMKKGWTKEKFDSISQEERNQAIKCIAF